MGLQTDCASGNKAACLKGVAVFMLYSLVVITLTQMVFGAIAEIVDNESTVFMLLAVLVAIVSAWAMIRLYQSMSSVSYTPPAQRPASWSSAVAPIVIGAVMVYAFLSESFAAGTPCAPLRQFFFIGAVYAPIVEELMFRGVVLDRLLLVMSVNQALMTQGVLFGLFHATETVIMAVFAHQWLFDPARTNADRAAFYNATMKNLGTRTLLGIGLGVVRMETGDLVLPMMLHSIFNLVVMNGACASLMAIDDANSWIGGPDDTSWFSFFFGG